MLVGSVATALAGSRPFTRSNSAAARSTVRWSIPAQSSSCLARNRDAGRWRSNRPPSTSFFLKYPETRWTILETELSAIAERVNPACRASE